LVCLSAKKSYVIVSGVCPSLACNVFVVAEGAGHPFNIFL
jgi:hypothetical protein